MNVSVKSKFTLLIIFMIIISIIFAYAITSQIVYKNVENRFKSEIAQNKFHAEQIMKRIAVSLTRNAMMISEDNEIIEFFSELRVIKNDMSDPNDIYVNLSENAEKYSSMMGRLERDIEKYSEYGERSKINIVYRKDNTTYINNISGNVIDMSDPVYKMIVMSESKKTAQSVTVFDKDSNVYIKTYSPIYLNSEGGRIAGGILVTLKVDEEILKELKTTLKTDVVLITDDNRVITSTIKEIMMLDKLNIKKRDMDINGELYGIEVSEIKSLEGRIVGYLVILGNKGDIIKSNREISIYLFIALFFVFSLIFLISIELIDTLTDSIKELTLKINHLREGDFTINFGKLKKRNDEIGILAQDFEEMVYILKKKIEELQEVSKNKEEYAEKLEKTNRELEAAKKETEEKSQNIDMINKMLNNRIREITNLYYMIINVSKCITEPKFYSTLIRGIRDGLRIRKIVLYELENGKYEIKGKAGINIENDEEAVIPDFGAMFDGEEIVNGKNFGYQLFLRNYTNPYIIPLLSEQDNKDRELFGFIIVDNDKELDEEEKRTIITYVKTIVMAFENRRLYLKLVKEITKLEKTTTKLQESERLKNIFLANVSHEIKIPMVPIKVYTEMMLGGKIGEISVKQRKGLITSLNNIERLEEIMDNILNYSRIEGGKYQIIRKRFNIVRIMTDALNHLHNKIESKRIKIKKEFDGNSFEAYADPEALTQVIINILSNAIKFSREGGIVTLHVNENEKDNNYTITIEDIGLGIDKAQIEYIFDSFKQLEEGNTRRYSGVGLGLTIVKYVLERHEKKIEIESQLNKGTKVSFDVDKYNEQESAY